MFLVVAPLFAQNAVTVTSYAPDETAGSFGGAVTTANSWATAGAAASGAITFAINPAVVVLSVTLPTITQSVTFEGNNLQLTGQNEAESQLLFEQSFTQLNGLQFFNNGTGSGLDVSVTAGSWNMAPTASAILGAANGATISTTSGVGVLGQTGGGVSVIVGSWTFGNNIQLTGGTGGAVTDTNGSGDQGGAGGSVSVSAVSLILPAANAFQLSGGAGGSVTDLGVGTNTGGNGGSVWAQSGFVSVGDSTVNMNGGSGGSGVTGGAGGGATFLSGSTSIGGSFSIQAGTGGGGLSTGGAGGNAYVTFGTLTQSAGAGQNTSVLGGNGGGGSVQSGDGGNASVAGTGVSLVGEAGFQVTGGNGGIGGTAGGGSGGSASVSLSVFSDAANDVVTVAGGTGGSGSSGAVAGSGGQGGNTSLTLVNFSVADSNEIAFGAGQGGNGGDNSGAGAGGAGGAGGTLAVTVGELELGSGSSLTLTGSAGGAGGNSTGGISGGGGNGGNVLFSANAVTLSAGSNLDLVGGHGGLEGTGKILGAQGLQGQVTASFGNLLNQGNLFLDSTNAILQVGTSFDQTSSGSLHLVLGGSGAVSLGFVTVGGTAQIGGDLVLTAGSGLTAPAIGQSVTLLVSNSLNGQFGDIEETLPGMRLLPIYLQQDLLLESINTFFQGAGATSNQIAIGADLDRVALNPQLNGLMASIGAMSNSSLQSAYNQLSPEDFTALYQAGFEGALARTALVDQRLSQLMEEVDSTPWLPGFSNTGTPWFAANVSPAQEATMVPSKTGPWGGFVSGNGGFFNVASDGNAAGYKVTTFGLTGAGADYRLSRQMVVGLMLGYGQTDVTLGTGGNLSANGGQLGLYGLFYSEGFYAAALAEGGLNFYTTQRQAYGGTAQGTAQGTQYDGALELGYQWKQDLVKIGPMASVEYSNVGMDGFTEQGSLAPLTLPSQSLYSLLSRLGVKANTHLSLDSSSFLLPSIQLAWEHEFNNQAGNMEAGFGTGDSFTVAGPQIGQDGLLAGAAVEFTWAKNRTLSLQYQGEFGRTNLDSNQFGGGLRLGF